MQTDICFFIRVHLYSVPNKEENLLKLFSLQVKPKDKTNERKKKKKTKLETIANLSYPDTI